MMVLVDTPVWSLALRRRPEHLSESQQSLADVLAELIRDGRAQMLGPIRQELLSGIREESQFKRIRDYLQAFQEPSLEAEDYENAARMSNQCRSPKRTVRGPRALCFDAIGMVLSLCAPHLLQCQRAGAHAS